MFDAHSPIDISILADIADASYTEPKIKLEAVRDAMSKGQLNSKLWLVHHLMETFDSGHSYLYVNVLIVGGWIGLLSKLLFNHRHSKSRISHITSLDIDPACETFANILHRKENRDPRNKRFTATTGDMYEFDYSANRFDMIINTSCEHIPNVQDWLDKIPDGKIVALQSNNFRIPEHINCVDSIDEFKSKVKLKEIIFSGELKFDMYTRYMIIGVK